MPSGEYGSCPDYKVANANNILEFTFFPEDIYFEFLLGSLQTCFTL